MEIQPLRYRINIDLSKYFNDTRKLSYIHIDKTKIKRITDLEKYIAKIFPIRGIFHLISNGNVYLPPNEDVVIVQPNEIITVTPGSVILGSISTVPDMTTMFDEIAAQSPEKILWGANSKNKKIVGDLYLCGTPNERSNELSNGIFVQQLPLNGEQLPIKRHLKKGFRPGSSIQIHGYIQQEADRLVFNLYDDTKNENLNKPIMIHFNPRFQQNHIVRNTFTQNSWGESEITGGLPLKQGTNFFLRIHCEEKGYRIFIDGKEFTFYTHRLSPLNITYLSIRGSMNLYSILYKTIE